jgi:hypothetical protein
MTDLTIRTLEASIKKIAQDTLSALRGKVRGTVALPGEDGYEAARTIWNGMVDRRPGLVVHCLGAADAPFASGSVYVNLCPTMKTTGSRRRMARTIAAWPRSSLATTPPTCSE